MVSIKIHFADLKKMSFLDRLKKVGTPLDKMYRGKYRNMLEKKSLFFKNFVFLL